MLFHSLSLIFRASLSPGVFSSLMHLSQEMEHRYQDFRQYVATAIDSEDTSTLSQLAQRYQKAAARMQQQQPQASSVAVPAHVAGAVHSFEALTEECKKCAPCLWNSNLLEFLVAFVLNFIKEPFFVFPS